MKKHSGATLAVTLLLLFVVSLLGISTMQVTQFQEKMASNLQDKELSFNAAESALAAGEAWVLSLSQEPPVLATCSPFPCAQETYQNINFSAQSSAWWEANSAAYPSQLNNIASPPRYIVEFLQFVPDSPELGDSSKKSTGTFYYQITARGTGSSDTAVSILQTTIGRRF
ncbi:pilus assembly PilX family protein [Legionella nagasakiensis]|uniref:pilus assembly PilX family protein n=1 Tax=Legionella nagasakiensis TaxID=535290 RepID=UPI0010544B8F|nr:PilX N-terminal domain-containing pilus assembly protein [Legionella nagasakiensis]